MARAFPPRPECPDIPDIAAIEGSLVDLSQEVSDAPPPAYEFPAFEFPMPNPPGNAFGCYGVSMSSRLNADSSGVPIVSSSIDPLFEAVIRYPKSSDTGVCQPVFDFNVKIPPCATILLGGQVTMDQTVSLPEVSISGGRDPAAPCASIFDFDFRIPCNTINIIARVSEVPGLPSPEWQVSSDTGTGVCVTDFILNLRLPPLGGGGDSGCRARMASTGDVTRSGLQTIDGVSGSDSDVVLLKDQSTPSENGAYLMRSGSWERACTMAGGVIVTVREGDANGATAWMLTTDDPIVVGTTPLTFELISGAACCCAARSATLENVTLSGVQTIDGITLVAEDVVLVKNQTDAKQNGPYLVKSGAWVRTCEVASGHSVNVREGLTQAQTIWMLVTNGSITLETTELTYRQVVDRPTVRVCTTNNHALSGITDLYDGITLSVDDVVLVAGQTTASQNGLYLAKAGAWVRTGDITPGMLVSIREGVFWAGHTFSLISYSSNPIIIGSTSLTFKALRPIFNVQCSLDRGPYGSPTYPMSGISGWVDLIAISAGSTILVFNSTLSSENGLWMAVDTGPWVRFLDTSTENIGTFIVVREGSRFGQVGFIILGGVDPVRSILGLTGVIGPYSP